MNKLMTILMLIASFVIPSYAFAFEEMPQDSIKGNRREQLREKLETMRNWKIIEEFNLDDARARKVFSILKETDNERAMLLEKRQGIHRKLKEISSNPNASDAEINTTIQDFLNINVDIAKIKQKEINNLKAVFTPKELIRFLKLQEELMRDIGQMLRDKSREGFNRKDNGQDMERRRFR